MAAFQGIHVSPAKHNYAWTTESVTSGQTDTQTDTGQSDPFMCRYASQATQKSGRLFMNFCFLYISGTILRRCQPPLWTLHTEGV